MTSYFSPFPTFDILHLLHNVREGVWSRYTFVLRYTVKVIAPLSGQERKGS